MRRRHLAVVAACLALLGSLVAVRWPQGGGARGARARPAGTTDPADPAEPGPPPAPVVADPAPTTTPARPPTPEVLREGDALRTEPMSIGDAEAAERHLRRFSDGRSVVPHWSDAVFASAERGVRACEPLPGERGHRRIEQLEQLDRNGAIRLLDSIDAGLAWLVAHQGADGVFQDDVAAARCRELGHAPCIGASEQRGAWSYPPAGTALAVLALLEFREQDGRGLFEPALALGVRCLRARQAPDGSFPGALQADAALTLLALGRAAEATRDPGLASAVRKGLACMALRADRDGGYRYDRNTCGDLRETAWVAQVADAARRAGVELPEGMSAGLSGFLSSVWQGGHRFSCERGAQAAGWLTPVGIHTGLLVWDHARRADVLDDWRRWLGEPPPERLYPLYYGARAAVALEPRLPAKWRDALFALANGQVREGDAAGTWRSGGAGGGPLAEGGYAGAGTVHVTAMAVLTLECALVIR